MSTRSPLKSHLLSVVHRALAAAIFTACLALAPASASAASSDGWGFGVADNVQEGWGNVAVPNYAKRMQPKIYRIQIPYDIMSVGPAGEERVTALKERIIRARQLGVQHVVATFGMGYWYFNSPETLRYPYTNPPTADTYGAEIRKVITEFNSYIDAWGPANEPNNGWQWLGDATSPYYGPTLLAGYFLQLKAALAELTVGKTLVSPDFHDTVCKETKEPEKYCTPDGLERLYVGGSDKRSAQEVYITRYLNAGGGWGDVAAFHPYGAVKRQSYGSIDQFRSMVPATTKIWITETGAQVFAAGANPTSAELSTQNNRVQGLVTYAKQKSQIQRVYYYNPWDNLTNWDSALLNNDGSPRPSWLTWCQAAAGNCNTADPGPVVLDTANEYNVWRFGSSIDSITTPHVAQRFVASDDFLRSVSIKIGGPSGGMAKVAVYRNSQQTDLVGFKTVHIKPEETVVNFDPALPLINGQTYYVQATSPVPGGQLQVFYSKFDDYAGHGAQYNWDTQGFARPDVLGRILMSDDSNREIYAVSRKDWLAPYVTSSHVAQQFTATLPKLKTVSAHVPDGPGVKYYLSVFRDKAQTQLVPGGQKLVESNSAWTATANFENPLDLEMGRKYYFQVIRSDGKPFRITRSARDDYPGTGSQIGWDSSDFSGLDILGRITGTMDSFVDTFWVWRYEPDASWVSVPQATQQFKATGGTIKSVSVNIGTSPLNKVRMAIFRDKAQTDLVANSLQNVTVNQYGETKLTYSQPVNVVPGQTYYMQILHPDGAPGNFQIYRSGYDDYQDGGAQYNWDARDFTDTDINGHIVSAP